MTIDIPSFQQRGYLLSYPDLGVADVCMSYGFGIYDACKDDKASTLARVRSIRCTLAGNSGDAYNPKIKIANGELAVELSNTASTVDSRIKVKSAIKSASPSNASKSPSPDENPKKSKPPVRRWPKASSKKTSAPTRG